jgi:hypothetical protein
MSREISIKAYSDSNNPEFQKHLKAVKFCIENDLSFPKETSEFFKGKVGGDNLEDIKRDCILSYIENGVEVFMNLTSYMEDFQEFHIKVSDIPKEASLIIIKYV